jgi:hypothetical protein
MGTTYHFTNLNADISPDTGEHHMLQTSAGSSLVVSNTPTVNGPVAAAGIPILNTLGNTPLRFWTPELAAFTLSGLVTANLFMQEVNGLGNAAAQIDLYKTDYAGRNVVPIIFSTTGIEITTSGLIPVTSWSFTPPATSFADGDRLLVIVALTDDTIDDGMVAGTTVRFRYNGNAPANTDSRLVFADTFTNLSPAVGNVHTLPAQGAGN